jgi:hypothetical protein
MMRALVTACCLSIGLGSALVGVGSASGAPTVWSNTNSPEHSGENSLTAVSCTSSEWCMAAGRGRAGHTLFESWSGSTWTVVPSPEPPALPTHLYGESCSSPQFCVAVGNDVTGSTRPVIETWNGTDWSVRHNPRSLRTSMAFPA